MSRFNFLSKYAKDGEHYDYGDEVRKSISDGELDRNSSLRWKIFHKTNPKITPDLIDFALTHRGGGDSAPEMAISHPNASADNIYKALSSPSSSGMVKANAIEHPNADSRCIDKALEVGHPYAKVLAVRHKNATREQIERALNDDDVKYAALARLADGI
jgi:hypothetical protein